VSDLAKAGAKGGKPEQGRVPREPPKPLSRQAPLPGDLNLALPESPPALAQDFSQIPPSLGLPANPDDPDDPAEQEARQIAQQALNPSRPASLPPLRRVGLRLQREAKASALPTDLKASGFIVEDQAEAGVGQLHKSEFLDQLRGQVCDSVNAVLAQAGQSTEGCPYVDYWFAYYRERGSLDIERALRRYAPESAEASSAYDYFPMVVGRVQSAVQVWASTKQVTGVPEDIPLATPTPGADQGPQPMLKGRSRPQGQRLQSRLGAGKPLEGSLRGRMEGAFGYDFSQVRLHTDSSTGGLANSLDARAFTLGHQVAFGPGEYQPGTLVGDALIAHELAHVVQQGGANPARTQAGQGETQALEQEADYSAIGAVGNLWGGLKGLAGRIAGNTKPSLQSGLSLQRCGKSQQEKNDAIFKIGELIGNPQANEKEVVGVIDEMVSDAADVLMHVSPFSPKSSDSMLNELAGSEEGQRIMAKAISALRDGSASSRVRADQLEKILKVHQAPSTATVSPTDQAAIDRINKAIDADPRKAQYLKAGLPLRFPVGLHEYGMEMMGGVYYSPSMPSDPKKGGDAARTHTSRWKSDKHPTRYPLIYIELGPLALAYTDEYIRSTLWHEFQHYQQYLSFREEESKKSAKTKTLEAESAAGGASAPNAELEATSIQLADDFSRLSDDEVKSTLRYLADHLDSSIKADFKTEATDRIKAAVSGDRAKQDRLLKLIAQVKRSSLDDIAKAIKADLAAKPSKKGK